MVSGGLGSRRVSNLQNARPSPYYGGAGGLMGPSKTFASRIRSSFHQQSGHKRSRTAHTAKRLAKHKAAGKTGTSKAGQAKPNFEFNVTSVGAPPEMADIEMGDATTSEPAMSRSTKRYRFPRELRRPPVKEIPKETLLKIDPELHDVDVEYVRDCVEDMGVGLLRTALNIKLDTPKDALPPSITVKLNLDPTTAQYPPPTHMLAIHTNTQTAAPRRITLVPCHSMVLALHCANLPPFAELGSIPLYFPGDDSSVTLPVQPLRVPHPPTFAPLTSFLYTQRTEPLLKSLFPSPPPSELQVVTSDSSRQFASHLAQTYTPQALLTHALRVHGLWQNTVALGVHTDELWDAIDLAWEILLTAIGFATGTEIDLLTPPTPDEPTSLTSSPVPAPTLTTPAIETADP